MIRQIRSFVSACKEYGVHAERIVQKPYVSFRTPTYLIGGSDFSFPRQGGFIRLVFLMLLHLVSLVRVIDKRIKESADALLLQPVREATQVRPPLFPDLRADFLLLPAPRPALTKTR